MSVSYIKLSDYNVAFKQLITGPAPVGRILNYVKLAGEGKLYHVNGHRDLSLVDGVASAWCSEFTVGLGLLYYVEDKTKTKYPLYLTENGKQLYELIKDYAGSFDEGINPARCKRQLLGHSKQAYGLFFKIFKSSPVCINLCRYIENAGTNKFAKSTFRDDYFECFKLLYEGGIYNRHARTTAGDNRVPSLLQLCEFFECMEETPTYYNFFGYKKLAGSGEGVTFIPIDEQKKEEIKKESTRNEKIITDLVDRYGMDGTVAREIVTRNSSVQSLFRNNLIAKYGCKCAICGKTIEKVLIASHIVPAGESDVLEKANCENGLLLCALHDKLFDRYLITFDSQTGKLIYCDELKEQLAEYQLVEGMTLDKKFMTEERKKNLSKHNAEFYQRNKK